ncbi:MAG: hypothetical protein ABII12_10645 [Planctomycetota bacterium]
MQSWFTGRSICMWWMVVLLAFSAVCAQHKAPNAPGAKDNAPTSKPVPASSWQYDTGG